MINTFIRKNLNISKERIWRPVEMGGLGFFNPNPHGYGI
jgi:hypothetical protein